MRKPIVSVILIAFLSAISLNSCREKKTTEDKIENAIDDTGDAIEDAADEVEDAVD